MVEGEEEAKMAQDQRATLPQGIESHKHTAFNGWIPALCRGVKLRPTVHSDTSGLAAPRGWRAWAFKMLLDHPLPDATLAPVNS